jgi:hypothetical protein
MRGEGKKLVRQGGSDRVKRRDNQEIHMNMKKDEQHVTK